MAAAEEEHQPGRGKPLEPQEHLDALKREAGICAQKMSVPPRSASGKESRRLSVQHMAAVIAGRGDGGDIDLVADALHQARYLEDLISKAKRAQPVVKEIVSAAVGAVKHHWSALHGVHLWDRLGLSRAEYDDLNHLLSFVYNPTTNRYEPIRVWTNPKDDSDFVLTARIATRGQRESEYATIASGLGITVGDDGRCERDATECVQRLYGSYAAALRSVYTVARPALPVLFLDGTGSSIGKGCATGR